jgi:hypothetical protein
MSDLTFGNEASFGGRFLRFENNEETRLISRVGPDALTLLWGIVDDWETHMFSTGGGSGRGGATGAAGDCEEINERRFGRKDIRKWLPMSLQSIGNWILGCRRGFHLVRIRVSKLKNVPLPVGHR